jgi:non-specific serine/threonine protein kinase/serine/threonine-protein kinase
MQVQLGPDHPNTLGAMNNLARAYRDAGKFDQALLLHEDALKLMHANLGPNHPNTLGAMAEVRARRGRFAAAAADLVQVREVKPDNHLVWHQLAVLFIASGQFDVYREHCRKSVERFGRTTEPLIAERIAKVCLILPASGANLDLVVKMTDTAVAATNHVANAWFQLVKGMAEFRQGNFTAAIEWVSKTLPTETENEPGRDVEAYMVLAMANYQLKKNDEARAAFSKGAEIERTKLPKLESGDIGDKWEDWIIAHALLREAKALIEDTSETKAATK